MQIGFYPQINTYKNIHNPANNRFYSGHVQSDIVNFTAMKKSQFSGIDLACIEKFKAPIGKFNSNRDLQNWASDKVKNIINTDFGGRHEESIIQRKEILKEWINHVVKRNDEYTPVMQLLILNAITKDLKRNEDNIPPILNEGILSDVMETLKKELDTNPKIQFNFNKIYQTKLSAAVLEYNDMAATPERNYARWIFIPSKKHNSEDFERNVDKLRIISHKNWCTKSFNALPYLEEGDFYIYFENGKPRICIRFVEDKIKEIQGVNNNGKIPLPYYDIVSRYITACTFDLSEDAEKEFKEAARLKIKADKIKSELGDAIEKDDIEKIFKYFNIDCEKLPDGKYKISRYSQPDEITFADLGIDEQSLLENVKIIEGDANFKWSEEINLENLQIIGGNANFDHSKIINLKNLQTIGGSVNFKYTGAMNLDSLKTINGSVNFHNSKILSIPNLYFINGNADFEFTEMIGLPSLHTINGDANFDWSKKISFPNLQFVYGRVLLVASLLTKDDFKNVFIAGKIKD